MPYSPQMSFLTLRAHIAALRKAEGLTQMQLSEKIGVSQPVLAGYEKGRRAVPVNLILPIAEALNVTLNNIFGINPEVKTPGPKPKLIALLEKAQKLPKTKQKIATQVIESLLED